ncbi:MAG TPA: choice-of-anchor tandem repeat GloVer-containing protein, partial [Verrucomicrobiae bacterium]|nr:choice-of-anchor tandem repeat GloVer-containing protein [Verrucomicrobiae bacterium]
MSKKTISAADIRAWLTSPIAKCSALGLCALFTMAEGCPKTITGVTTSTSGPVRFHALHSFGPTQTQAPVIQSTNGYFYGTTYSGGAYGWGTLFRVSASGSNLQTYSFTGNTDGAVPMCGLLIGTNGLFYGATSAGGSAGYGTIFSLDANLNLTTLYSFTNGIDGANPYGPLMQANDGNFYGTAYVGGSDSFGTVYRITPPGQFTPLYSFSNGVDGGRPYCGLVQASDGNLYGSTSDSSSDFGGLFRISTSGMFSNLLTFANGTDGAVPYGTLVAGPGGALYGTTLGFVPPGGTPHYGDIFRLTTAGVLTTVYSFTNGLDGSAPWSGLTADANGNLYGTASSGGDANAGTVFELTARGQFQVVYSFNSGAPYMPASSLLLLGGSNLYGTVLSNGAVASSVLYSVGTNGSFNTVLTFPGPLDGASLRSALVRSPSGLLYGTASQGGLSQAGTIFQMQTNGILSPAYAFTGEDDGANPNTLYADADGSFYGTASTGGANQLGTLFHFTTNGAVDPLYSFTGGADGANPQGAVILASDGWFYGTASAGGSPSTNGTLFRFRTLDGALLNMQPIYSFSGGNDGSQPDCALLQASDGNLYGTTYAGGSNNLGTVFRLTTNGILTSLYSFLGGTNGSNPYGGLIQAEDGYLYGTTEGGTNFGSVYRIGTNGSFTNIYAFQDDGDGLNPYGPLIQATDGFLYGTTSAGNASGNVFLVSTNGVFTNLYTFTGGIDGGTPLAGLIQVGDSLYGTCSIGGVQSLGTAYSITLFNPPATTLAIQVQGQTIVLTWVDPYSAFILESAPTLQGPYTP